MGRLDDRTALITGAGSGIGAACAELFSAERANVFCADLEAGAAQEVADRVTERGGSAAAGSVDVTKRDQCEDLVASVVDRFGGLDVLVNSAGVTPRKGAVGVGLRAEVGLGDRCESEGQHVDVSRGVGSDASRWLWIDR